jgi:hypothetical protein
MFSSHCTQMEEVVTTKGSRRALSAISMEQNEPKAILGFPKQGHQV